MDFGLSVSSVNHPIYKENIFDLFIAKKLLLVDIGSSVSYVSTKINTVNNKQLFLSFGMKTELENWSAQFSINKISLSKTDENVLEINMENAYDITNSAKISIGIFKENYYDFSVRMGLFQQFTKNFAIITSYQYSPDRFGIGVKFKIKKINIIYGIRTHQELDLTHALSIGYNF
jgi:hypothetical protein